MVKVFVIVLLGSFTSAFAGGCPPWLPCGKFGNLIIADPEYGSAVAGSLATAPTASSSQEANPEVLKDLVNRIQVAESVISSTTPKSSSNMNSDSGDAARQREILRHPQPWFWGYDWGQPGAK